MVAGVMTDMSPRNEEQRTSAIRRDFSVEYLKAQPDVEPKQKMETCILDQSHLLYFPRRKELIIQKIIVRRFSFF
jgi:hypothetical protein